MRNTEPMTLRIASNWMSASAFIVLLFVTRCTCQATSVQAPIALGTAEDFTVLAYATVTNTGPSTVGGLIGVSPGTAITGQASISFSALPSLQGIASASTAAAAKLDVGVAYADASSRVIGVVVIGGGALNIGGLTFTPGLYKSNVAMMVAAGTNVTLSGAGVYIFQMETTLIMNTYTHMVLTNGAQACDVFWRVGSAATFNVGSTVVGTVMAYSAITVQTNVQVEGRLFALNAAVTLDTATVVFPC
jgi:hypothetical protein